VLSLPLTRRLLTRQRETQIKGYFHRHGYKILVSGRFVPGFRTAAYLTAGILKLPFLKLLVTDVVAASLTTLLMFGLGYGFAHKIQSGIREAQQWVMVIAAIGVAIWLLVRYDRARRRSGLPVGPPVMESDDVPLPASDLLVPAGSSDPATPAELKGCEIAVDPEPSGDDRAGPAAPLEPPGGLPVRRSHGPVTIDVDAGQPHSSIESPSR
jgi:hypothetical protein